MHLNTTSCAAMQCEKIAFKIAEGNRVGVFSALVSGVLWSSPRIVTITGMKSHSKVVHLQRIELNAGLCKQIVSDQKKCYRRRATHDPHSPSEIIPIIIEVHVM